MKVVLKKDVPGTGKKDQIVEVSDGYGRNYLLPRKLAVEATATELNSIEKQRAAQRHREDVKKAEAEVKARELKGKVVIVKAKGGEGGKLYGQVTGSEIAAALKEQHGVEVDKRKIELSESVRSAGQTLFTVKLVAGVSTRMILNVVIDK